MSVSLHGPARATSLTWGLRILDQAWAGGISGDRSQRLTVSSLRSIRLHLAHVEERRMPMRRPAAPRERDSAVAAQAVGPAAAG